MKSERIILVIVFVISGTILLAQDEMVKNNIRPKNNLNLTFFGEATLISINYERLFLIVPSFFITCKLGIGYEEFQLCIFEHCGPRKIYLTLPHYFTGNLGKGRHFFEFGLGGTYITGDNYQNYFIYPVIGYRIQPLKSDKAYFRIFCSIPFTGLDTEEFAVSPVGLSLGVSF